MRQRLFTVQEANELIPFLSERLPSLRALFRAAESLSSSRTPSLQDVLSRGGMIVDGQYLDLALRLQDLLGEICAQGCQVKDLDEGLVDFPTLFRGREVYLCWKLGEDAVSFWHEIDAGFAGRRPLEPECSSG